LPRRPAFAALALLAGVPLWAAQPQFWRIEGARDFLQGDTEGVSVDSEGRLRIAPASRLLHDPAAPNVWALAVGPEGVLYAGTGNEGKVFRLQDGKATLFYDAAELEVHALAQGPDGRLYVATSPDGRVYAVEASGKATSFFDPADKYVWALAFDRQGRLLVATGAEGRVYRVDAKGQAETLLESGDAHVLCLALDGKGNVFAGSAPSGILYRIDPAKKVFVVTDTPFREVKAVDAGPDGSLYLALVDAQGKEEPARAAAAAPPTPTGAGAPTAEVTVTESFAVAAPGAPADPARTTEAPAGAARSAVMRVLPSGEVDSLWSSAEETVHALLHVGPGVVVATGSRGKLYSLRDDRSWSMLSAYSAEQITALARGSAGALVLASSNPGRVYALDAAAGTKGTFVSKVKDTETVSSWGRLRWQATVPAGAAVEVQTRSGNTTSPDATWSDWSPPYARKEGEAVTSERARFLQVRVTLSGSGGSSPVVDSIATAFLQRNLRPQVQAVTVHPPGEVFQKPLSVSGDMEILGLDPVAPPDRAAPAPGTPPAVSFSRKMYQRGIQTFSWKAEDANGDTLAYDVYYRPVGDARFRPLRRGLTEPVLAWDTSTVPNGRYVVKVAATDAPTNPPAMALVGERESLAFEVDNTPPSLTATLVQRDPPRIRAVARDDSSLIRRAETSVDGGRWEELHPSDGINDSLEETYDLTPDGPAKGMPRVLVLRVFDLLGNAATARVEIP
jgi:outer membrane protein assembly factor BamB